ncbi:hypothetical protein Tco_0424772 [Tanacetum coccineum]
MYHGEKLYNTKLKIDLPDSEETLEDAEESRLKMRNKMVQLDYYQLNALYETFVPQQEPSVDQTYFSIPSTSYISSESKEVKAESQIPKMPKESKLLKIQRRWMSDSQNSLKEFYKTDVIPMSNALSKNMKALKQELMEENQNDFKRSQAQSIDFELTLKHQKDKMACDVSWKSKVSKLNDENVLLKSQVDYVVQERENIKLVYQKLFNFIKATRAQHKQEVNELIKNISQKIYAYGDVRKLLCVTPLSTNITVQAKKVSRPEDNTDRPKPVTSHFTPKNEHKQKQNVNVISIGMYKLSTQLPHMQVSKTNMNVSNSTGVESSTSVIRPQSKDTKSKHRVLKKTNAKSSSAHVQKMSSSVRPDFNKHETKTNSKECQSNASVLKYQDYSRVKRALFTSPLASKSRNLGASSVVAKFRFSVAQTLTTTNKVIQLVLLIVDSGCSKHMIGNLKLLRNFVEKSMGTVRFGNDHFTAITRYGDYVQGNLMICHVYYVEGLGHNLFLVGQLCDGDLEVAFRSNTCYVQNLEGDDLLTNFRESNLYTISISELAASSPVCLMSKATSTKSCDHDDLGKMKPNADIGIFIGYSESSSGFRKPITQESSTPVLESHSDEQIQEDVAEFNGDTIIHSFKNSEFEEA